MKAFSRIALPVIVALALTVIAPVAAHGQGALPNPDLPASPQAGTVHAADTPIRASDLLGYTVAGPDGETLGHVADLVVRLLPAGDMETGIVSVSGGITETRRSRLGEYVGDVRLAYALVGYGGFLGLNQQLRPIPLSGASIDTENQRFLVDFGREMLERVPGFDAAALMAAGDAYWDEDVRLHWEGEGILLPAATTATRVFRLSELSEWPVLNLRGEQVAQFNNLIVEPDSADGVPADLLTEVRVRYAVIGFGGFLGLREDLIAVPVSLMGIGADPELEAFYLDADPTQLQNAPQFDPAGLPSGEDPTWDIDFAGYWGVEEYLNGVP